jgi:hypothetical protein
MNKTTSEGAKCNCPHLPGHEPDCRFFRASGFAAMGRPVPNARREAAYTWARAEAKSGAEKTVANFKFNGEQLLSARKQRAVSRRVARLFAAYPHLLKERQP